MSDSDGQAPPVDPTQPAVFFRTSRKAQSLETASGIKAEIDLLKGERTRWRDYAARGVVTVESFIVVSQPLVGRIAALEQKLAAAEPPESPRTAA